MGDCIKGDCSDGKGTYTYADGSVYTGQWENSQRNGAGTYTSSSGSIYKGQWKNDKFDGQGSYIYQDGSQYQGRWQNNMRNGQGIYTTAAGAKYKGQWKNGKLIGKGILITPDGNKFMGQFNTDGKLIGEYVSLTQNEAEIKRKTEQEARVKAEAVRKTQAEARAKTEAEIKRKTEQEARVKAEAERKAQAKVRTKIQEESKKKETPTPEEPKYPQVKKSEAAPDKKIWNGPNGMKFVYISPGTFMMGSSEEESGRYDNERQHKVTLDQGIYLQITEVTQGQWASVMGNNPSFFSGCGDDCPVEQVSWNDVQQFIWRLNQLEGNDRYRLPSEAEWEYACRSGSTGAFSTDGVSALECGHDAKLTAVAWFCGNSGKKSHPVAQKSANAWGLYDMHGNISELCLDWYGEYPPDQVTNPKGIASGLVRTVRGGGWNSYVRHCRSACRGAVSAGESTYDVGFRLVRMP